MELTQDLVLMGTYPPKEVTELELYSLRTNSFETYKIPKGEKWQVALTKQVEQKNPNAIIVLEK